MPGLRQLAVAVAALVAVASGCSGTTTEPRADSRDRPTGTPSTPVPSPTSSAPPEERLVVVSRPTDPQLDLTAAQARRIVADGLTRWRGRPVSVVPLEEVGPTQVVARVGGAEGAAGGELRGGGSMRGSARSAAPPHPASSSTSSTDTGLTKIVQRHGNKTPACAVGFSDRQT